MPAYDELARLTQALDDAYWRLSTFLDNATIPDSEVEVLYDQMDALSTGIRDLVDIVNNILSPADDFEDDDND